MVGEQEEAAAMWKWMTQLMDCLSTAESSSLVSSKIKIGIQEQQCQAQQLYLLQQWHGGGWVWRWLRWLWCPDDEESLREENIFLDKQSWLEVKDISKEESKDVVENEGGLIPDNEERKGQDGYNNKKRIEDE